jgi:predicted TIM-barrel fold metal-dependent hydrolase
VANPVFIEGLKLMQQADLTLDAANPNAELIEAVLKVTDKVPGLRIVFDHLPGMLGRVDANTRAAIEGNLRELSKRPQVYIKVSEIIRLVDGRPSTDQTLYRPTLDYLFDTFGENRLIFGSDWPNAAAADNLPAVVKIVRDYFETR